MTTTLLRPGDVLGGFRVEDVIGVGGMAIVYRAEQLSLGRSVALKVLSSRLTSDSVFRERFRREGAHAAALEHPSIVPVYDCGEVDGVLYLAMRLVEGTNLAELIQTRGLTADRTIEILRPIASALDTAHAAGLVHRDVKPQNILINLQGYPYLADFGVAKGSNTYGLTATGGFVGSVNYASPEQINGQTLTPASDIYALTAVLFQCLTGQVPYPRETDAGVMHAHLSDPPPTLPSRCGADSDLHTVLARGMAKDSGSRYGHAGDLLTAAALCIERLPSDVRKAMPAFPAQAGQDADGSDDTEGGRRVREQRAGADPTELVDAAELAAARQQASETKIDRRIEIPPGAAPSASRGRWSWLRRSGDGRSREKDRSGDGSSGEEARSGDGSTGEKHRPAGVRRRPPWWSIAGFGVAAGVCLALVLALTGGSGKGHPRPDPAIEASPRRALSRPAHVTIDPLRPRHHPPRRAPHRRRTSTPSSGGPVYRPPAAATTSPPPSSPPSPRPTTPSPPRRKHSPEPGTEPGNLGGEEVVHN